MHIGQLCDTRMAKEFASKQLPEHDAVWVVTCASRSTGHHGRRFRQGERMHVQPRVTLRFGWRTPAPPGVQRQERGRSEYACDSELGSGFPWQPERGPVAWRLLTRSGADWHFVSWWHHGGRRLDVDVAGVVGAVAICVVGRNR